jgi:hypothetical protein
MLHVADDADDLAKFRSLGAKRQSRLTFSPKSLGSFVTPGEPNPLRNILFAAKGVPSC